MKIVLLFLAFVAVVTCDVAPTDAPADPPPAVAPSSTQSQRSFTINCMLCQAAVKAAQTPTDNGAHTIESAFDAECKSIFQKIPFIEGKCESYVNSKIDPIIAELEGGTATQDICGAINEC